MEINIKNIIEYSFDNNEYLITLVNDIGVLFTRKENGKLNNKLSKYELYIGLKVLDLITFNEETSVFIKNKKIRNKIYSIFFDKHNRLYWWKALDGKITHEDDYELNLIYNHISKYVFCDNERKEEKNINLRRIINGKEVLITLLDGFLISATILTPIAGIPILLNKFDEYKLKKEFIEFLDSPQIKTIRDVDKILSDDEEVKAEKLRNESGNTEYDWRELKYAVLSNENLTEEEKDFILQFKFVFDEDNEYMNLELIKERLSTLKIYYKKEKTEFEKKICPDGTLGMYEPDVNHIYFFETDCFNNTDKRVAFHELGHALEIPSPGKSHEYTNVIWQRECLKYLYDSGIIDDDDDNYLDINGAPTNFGFGYQSKTPRMYLLLKLVGKDVAKKYHYQTDERVLANALIELDKNGSDNEKEERAYRLVETINYESDTSKKLKEQMDEYDENEYDFYTLINYYYKIKYGHTVQEDLNSVVAFMGYNQSNLLGYEFETDGRNDLFYSNGVEGSIYDSEEAMCEMFGIPFWENRDAHYTGIPESIFYGDTPACIYIGNETGGKPNCYTIGEQDGDTYRNNYIRYYEETLEWERKQKEEEKEDDDGPEIP